MFDSTPRWGSTQWVFRACFHTFGKNTAVSITIGIPSFGKTPFETCLKGLSDKISKKSNKVI